jgi:uncharacterized protein YqkB
MTVQIDPTPAALEQLTRQYPATDATLRLVYDIEGCGCAVDGVVQLWAENRRRPDDAAAYEGQVAIMYDPRQAVFFEERIKLDYNADKHGFTLSSNSQIYHSDMSIVDRRS